jgi:DnaK suppressor protein
MGRELFERSREFFRGFKFRVALSGGRMMPAKRTLRQDKLKKSLLDMKRRMWNDLREELFSRLGREYNVQFDNPHDLEELSLIDVIEDTGIAVADIRREEIERLDEALRMMEDGAYGVCAGCGEEIADERLKVMPFATRCVRCKADAEPGKKPTL